ncbi:MAG: hypothetical protein WBN52_12150 [Eudoraea sp.]|uniref:hypothetical protein n=1 Tax=Eudoraea sp. TaxID=1979955 RepID=UPI003C72F47A
MKMKFLIVLLSFCLCNVLSGQIKIGDNPQNIDASSVLELESSNRVLVITRINTSQMNSIVPSQGAIIYNTDEQCLYFYDGAAWLNMCETFGLTFTADPIVNPSSTIVITENGDNRNFEVGEITGANIVDFSISGNDIQNNSITADKLAPDSVGSEELQDNTVADAEIDYNQVTLNDFNNDAGFITGADIVSAAPNNAITDNGGAFYDNTPLQNDIAANAAAIAADGDTDAGNEIQNLALAGNNLTISGANTVDLGVFNNAGTDDQQLTLTGNTLAIEDGNTVDLSILNNPGTDEQDLTGATLSGANILQIDIENGASATVDLSALSGTGTDNQNLTGATLSPANVLQIDIEDGTSATVDLSGLSGTGTDNQNLTAATLSPANILQIDIEDGTSASVDLSALSGTGSDNQNLTGATLSPANILQIDIEDGTSATVDLSTLSGVGSDNQNLTGATLSPANILQIDIEDGTSATVDLSTLSGIGTDNQNLTGATLSPANILQIDIEDGTSATVDLSALAAAGTDDQIAAEVPFTDYLSITSPNVQGAVAQLKDELDAVVVAGGGNPIDELQDLQLAGNILSLTNPATVGNNVDLSGFINDADADPANELQNITSADLSVTINPVGTGFDLSVPAGSDNQNIEGSGLAVETLTIGIQNGTSQDVSLAPFALETELAAAIAASDAADGDTDDTNEIQNITSTDGSVNLVQTGDDYDLSVAAGSDDQNLTSATLAGTNLTIAIENGNPAIADLSALATDAELAALSIDDADANPTNEIQNITSGDGSVAITPAGIGFDLSVAAGSDDQNIQGSGLAGELLTIGIEGGTGEDVNLAAFALETEVTAAIAVSDAADGDTDDTNELQNITSGDGSVTIASAGIGFDLSVTGGSDDQNLTSAILAGTDLTITIEDGTAAIADLSALATDIELAAFPIDDADADPANEIQSLSISGSDLSISGGNTVTLPAAGTADWSTITSIPAGFADNVDDDTTLDEAAVDAFVANNGFLLIEADGDPANEIQSLSISGSDLSISGGNTVTIPGGAGTTELADQVTIDGDGTMGNEFQIADGGVTAAKIAIGAISGGAGGAIVDNSITASDLQPDSVDASEIRIDAVGSSEIADDAVTTTEILNGTILNVDISATAAIDGTKIIPNFNLGIVTTGGLSVGADILLNGNAVVPDYVFQKYFLDHSDINETYNFSSLEEIEAFVKKNHHLPGIKSAKDVQKDGFWNLSESNLQNLEKIEELFLHTINQEKEINQLKTKNESLATELDLVKKDLEEIKELLKNKKLD